MAESKELAKEFGLEEIITTSVKIPGVKVDRNKLLAESFSSNPNIKEIMELGPVAAGITQEEINNVAQKLILKRTSQSSIASFAAGIPGGLAMAATVPMDVAQFFGMALRLAQELAYLYGAENLWKDGQVDDERVRSQLIVYCGAMFGVSSAVSGVRVISTQLAKTAAKQIPQKALTKTFWYPIVKQIGKLLSIKVTKQTVANGVAKAVPVIGGVISGSLNFASMMPMAKRLNTALDKAAFDYSEEELLEDIEMIENPVDEVDTKQEIADKVADAKDKVSLGLKFAGKSASKFVSKIGARIDKATALDPVEEIKKYKELLDSGIITQEEFDSKKSELLGL